MNYLARTFVIIGVIFIILGIFFHLGGKTSWFGRLPGDILIKRNNFTFYFPLMTSILLSIILSLLLRFFFRR